MKLKRGLFPIIPVCLALLLYSAAVLAADVSLSWDANTEPGLAGYKMYYWLAGPNNARQYLGNIDIPGAIDVPPPTTVTISGLQNGKTYYFAATAYDTAGNESDYSAEVAYTVPYLPAVVYEDGGDTAGWEVYAGPAGAAITNPDGVIALNGAALDNGYRLRNDDGTAWNNTSQFVIQWSLRYDEDFRVMIDAETTVGHRYISYWPQNYDPLGAGEYVYLGLGADLVDGQWHLIVRDLQADLEKAQAGARILAVNGFLIHGSGLVDDIKLMSSTAQADEPPPAEEPPPPSGAVNNPPVADAGVNQTIREGNTVFLDGTNSYDPDGDSLFYYWVQTSGPAVVLSDPVILKPFFTAPDVGVSGASLSFRLVVIDEGGLLANDSCQINITWNNMAPVADAGSDQSIFAQSLKENITFQLDGTASSDPDDGIAAYLWTQTAGPTAILYNPTSVTPSFKVPAASAAAAGDTLVFRLKVTDYSGFTANADVFIEIIDKNDVAGALNPLMPTIYEDAEDENTDGWDKGKDLIATVGYVYDSDLDSQVIELKGSELNDPDKTPTKFILKNIEKTIYSTSFSTWNNANQFEIEWKMKYSRPFTIHVIVNTTGGTRRVSYEPSSTDALGNLEYVYHGLCEDSLCSDVIDGQWHTFRRDLQADLSEGQPDLKIISVDGFEIRGSGRVDEIRLIGEKITPADNLPPVADAGPNQIADEGEVVYLDAGNSYDPEGTELFYSWTKIAGPPVYLMDKTSSTPSFTTPDVGYNGVALVFQVTVTDDDGRQATATTIVNVTWGNDPPVADAGIFQEVGEGQYFTLDGTNSYDPDDGIASFLWVQIGGMQVNLLDPTSVTPLFTAPSVGPEGEILTFQLTVTDYGGLSASAAVSVYVFDINNSSAPAGPLLPTVYENAEDLMTSGWEVYYGDPNAAEISNEFDEVRDSQVIRLAGAGRDHGYRLRNYDLSKWQNTSQFIIEWSMSYAEDFTVLVDVRTSGGNRSLTYTAEDYNALGTMEYIYHGLGSGMKDGQWHTIQRDLQADLDDAQPGLTVLEVNGFQIRGSGRVDDILLRSAME